MHKLFLNTRLLFSQFCCFCFFLLSCVSAFAATLTWTGDGANNLASAPANWGGAIPQTGDSIVLNATSGKHMTWDAGVGSLPDNVASWTQTAGYTGTVTILTVYPGQGAFNEFRITGSCVISNGVWTHAANPASVTNVNNELYRLRVDVATNLTIGPDGIIDVTAKGYRGGKGPGSGGSAGSYGGRGNTTRGAGPCYGSVIAPTNLGSGGGYSGGGAVFITVSGELRNNGVIRAYGEPVSYYSGSGGSIYIRAGSLTGNGDVRAQGGTTAYYYAGGGGRVAVVLTNANFSGYVGTISAYAGEAAGVGSFRGNAGTVYLEKQGDAPGNGELVVDNYGGAVGYIWSPKYFAYNTSLGGDNAVTCAFQRITFTNTGILDLGPSHTLIVSNTIFVSEHGLTNGIWLNGATLLTPPNFVYSNMFIAISATGTVFSPASSLTVGTGAGLCVDKPHVMNCNLIIGPDGKLSHTANGGYVPDPAYKVDLTVNGDLTVATGGRVDVSGQGYSGASSPAGVGTGGGYGGRNSASAICFGSVTAPTNVAGSESSTYRGGGAVKMRVSGTIQNNGVICSDGGSSGRGAGGSVWLESGNLTGNGVISANGNVGRGGGRVALVVTNSGADFSTYSGSVSAFATSSGGAGTVYKRKAGQDVNSGELIIDNNNVNANTTEIGPYVTDALVGDVVIRNSGRLVVDTNETLTLSGVWSNAAIFEGRSGSQVVFGGGALSTSKIYGVTSFMGFTSTNTAGKTIMFEAGKTNAIAAYGRLRLAGSETATNMVLKSTSAGSPWMLNVNSLADQYVFYADVRDSDATPGAQIIALNSMDRGGNSNWLFMQVSPGETNVWTGNSNTVWSVPLNWSLGRPPIEDDFIMIPGSMPRYPALNNHRTVAGIEIQTGASLSLAGYNFTVSRNALISGALIASATETVTFMTNASFSGGSFTPALSTIALSGSGAQSFNPGNLAFYRINALNAAGTVDFLSGFSAVELRCEAPAGTRSLRFAQGSTVTLRDFVMSGNTATTNITLRSSVNNQKWNLAVDGYRFVRGVDVRDSDASGGLAVHAVSSLNSGGNINWTFDADQSVWLGTSSVNFHDSANWNTGVVPGAGDRVVMDSANPMTVTNAVTLLDLTVGGGPAPSSATVNAPLTVLENIMVLTNGTLSINQPGSVGKGVYLLDGGTLTHSVNKKLELTVHSNMELDVNAAIDVTGKGFKVSGSSSSHGGRGYISAPCFGSIISPTNLGVSGGWENGGGAVLLKIAGTLKHGGAIYANGGPGTYYMGSGGSINITAGALTGTGVMEANGGVYSGHSGGGGGRIALVVTNTGADLSLFTGQVHARSSYLAGSVNAANNGAGTVYTENSGVGRGRGTVVVDNGNFSSTGNTDVPPAFNYTAKEASWVVFRVANSGKLRLTNDFTVGDIWLDTSNAILDLGFNTLYVNSFPHDLGPGSVINYGEIKWIQGALIQFW